MRNTNELGSRFADKLDLSGEPIPGMSIIEIAGGCRVLVERHHGVIEYGNSQIRISVSFGVIQIKGCSLELISMTKEQLIIGGHIDCISIDRR